MSHKICHSKTAALDRAASLKVRALRLTLRDVFSAVKVDGHTYSHTRRGPGVRPHVWKDGRRHAPKPPGTKLRKRIEKAKAGST